MPDFFRENAIARAGGDDNEAAVTAVASYLHHEEAPNSHVHGFEAQPCDDCWRRAGNAIQALHDVGFELVGRASIAAAIARAAVEPLTAQAAGEVIRDRYPQLPSSEWDTVHWRVMDDLKDARHAITWPQEAEGQPVASARIAEIRGRLGTIDGPWQVSDADGELGIWNESALWNVIKDDLGQVVDFTLPGHYTAVDQVATWDLDTWEYGEDEDDDLRRNRAEFLANAPTDIADLLAHVDLFRDALTSPSDDLVRAAVLAWREDGARRGVVAGNPDLVPDEAIMVGRVLRVTLPAILAHLDVSQDETGRTAAVSLPGSGGA